VRDAVAALKQGADDFLTKPLDMDHLLLSVERLVERQEMRRELERMRGLVGGGSFHGMVGNSRAMQRLADQIRLIARADGPVLIVGESGTGKELVAKAIHRECGREGPFVAINCAGIPGELIESELFGYEAGAFTGAKRRRKGIFQQAHGGSLLLDEIGEMPLELQAKLLRVLEEGSVRPVGAEGEQAVDVRVLAATHRDVRALAAEGRFREDLYYRLETFMLEVPALREREDDLELLASHFLRQHAARLGRDIEALDQAALDVLRSYPFPGNVRELSNVMERATVFTRGREIAVADLPGRVTGTLPSGIGNGTDTLEELARDLPSLDVLQRRYARRVLRKTNGNKQRAAAILGITRGTLYRWLEESA
jgi:DNA-binding NtrC family response regulator